MTFRRIGKGKSREEKCLWLCLCAALLISICFIELVLFDRTSGVLLATVLSYRFVDSTA